MQRLPDGELEFRHPCGYVIPQVPPARELVADSEALLRTQTAAAGVEVGAKTLLPNWDGARLNLGYAISVMHPRANGGH